MTFTISAVDDWGVESMKMLEKCWEIKECSKKSECVAFPHFGRTCWMIKGEHPSTSNVESSASCEPACESCEVYLWHKALTEFIRRQRAPLTSP